MNIETAGRTIQLILAPVVMVTACGILLTGMLAHYSAINVRIRALAAERLELAFRRHGEGNPDLARERLAQIDHQVPMLIDRHRQVHHAILFGNSAVVLLVVSMFVIGAAALAKSSATGTVALFIFLAGTASLMVGATFMALEVRQSHSSVAFEAMRAIELPVMAADDRTPDAG